MKFPLSWLHEYIDPGLTPAQIAKTLTSAGLEVDGVETNTLSGDSIFEVSLTPNLGHCSNMIGIARELSAATGRSICYPTLALEESKDIIAKDKIKITILDEKGSPRYACRIIKDVTVGPSPEWLKQRLAACGLRSINNVVDVTNYVLLEMGHPLHAFDYNLLEEKEIIVRGAKEGEKFTTLDGKERILCEGDLLICDKNKPVALAGIMGGQNSEVSETTTQVLLEGAYFHPGTIRKTSKRLGLFTDASKRFERGSDPNQMIQALDRAAQLIKMVAGGQILGGMIDVKNKPFLEKLVTCRLSRINRILGMQLGVSEVENVFQRLAFKYSWDGQDCFAVTIPTYRVDIAAEIDLIEEVARIYGYDNIARPATVRYAASNIPHAPLFLLEREIRSRLISEGLQEFVTCDLIGPTLLAKVHDNIMPEASLIKVLNPTSIEQSILRTSLLPGLLEVVKHNVDHQNHDLSGFEVGRVHFKQNENYNEQSLVGIVLTGKCRPHFWGNKPHESDFFQLKGILENLFKELNIANVTFKPSTYPTLHSGRQAGIYVGDLELGSMGEVHPAIQRRLDVPQRIYFAEISLHAIMETRKKEILMRDLSIYPASERDWTVTVGDEVSIQDFFTRIHSVASPLLEKVTLIDLYRSDKLGEGKKNLTFRFVYRDMDKTIEQDAVETEHARIITEVNKGI